MEKGKRMAGIAFLVLIISAFLSGCGGSAEPEKGAERTEEKVRPAPYEDVPFMWEESFTVEREGKKSTQVTADAMVIVPGVSQMNLIETKEFSFDSGSREKIARAFFGDADVYCFDSGKIPREELEKRLEQAKSDRRSRREQLKMAEGANPDAPDLDEEERARLNEAEDRIKRLKKLLKTAGEDYIRAETGAYTGNFYRGTKEGVRYNLSFVDDEYFDGDGEKDSILRIEPEDYADVAPEEQREATQFGISEDSSTGTALSGNQCPISSDEALAVAQEFMRDMGVPDGMCLDTVNSLHWRGWSKDTNFREIVYGYFVRYRLGVDGQPIKRSPTFTLYITERGIFRVVWEQPREIISRTEKVSMLPFDSIKDMIKNQIGDRMEQEETGQGALIEDVAFTKMELDYSVITDEETKQYSYIPVWYVGCSGMVDFCVNAMDGSIMDCSILNWDYNPYAVVAGGVVQG